MWALLSLGVGEASALKTIQSVCARLCVCVRTFMSEIRDNSVAVWSSKYDDQMIREFNECIYASSAARSYEALRRKGEINGTMHIKYAWEYNQLQIWQQEQQQQRPERSNANGNKRM